jgi:tetratricopeptide (TPR) repeat protein
MKLSKSFTNALIVVLAVLMVAGCGGAESRKAKYLERGKDYLQKQNYDKAIVELKNVLQIDPKHAEAYYLIGQTEEAQQNWQRSFGSYLKAVELDPDHLEARTRLARFYLLANKEAEARKEMETVLAKQPEHVGALLLKAMLLSKEGKNPDALIVVNDIVENHPLNHEAYALKSAIYLSQKEIDKGIEVLQQGISANPKNIPLRLNLIQVYLTKGEFGKIDELFQQCITIEPQNLKHRLSFASFQARTNQLEKAEKILRDTITQDPDDEQRYLLLADFLAKRKSLGMAEQELLAAIKKLPKSSNLRYGLANIYEQMGDMPRAMDTFREMISRYGTEPDGLRARNLLAEMQFRQGKKDEADKLTEEVLQENPGDNSALLMRAKLLLGKRDTQGAITALRTVLRDQPDMVDAYLYLADAHTLNKEPALAKESLMKGVEQNPMSTKAHLALAKYYAQTGDMAGAAKKVDETLKLSPNDFEALEARLELLILKKDTKGAQATLEQIKRAHPDNPMGYYQLGQLYLSQRKHDAAIGQFELALARSNDGYTVMSAIVRAYLDQKKPDKAIARVNELLTKNPSSSLYAHELLGEIYITQKKHKEAEQALRKAIEHNPKWNVPYRNLANIYRIRNDFSSAEQVYQEGLKAIPGDMQLLLSMAETYERTGNYEKAILAYDQALSIQPSNDLVANNLAALLLDHRTDADSLARARELVARFESTTQPALMDTLGWMYYRHNEFDKAVSVMEKVVKQTPDVPVFRYHLGMGYYKKGDLRSAKSHLTKAVETKSGYPGLVEARETLKKIP